MGGLALLPLGGVAADPSDVRTHADQSFELLRQQREVKHALKSAAAPHRNGVEPGSYSSDAYLIGKGQGDMAKGAIVCQRVSELSARTDLAKQIRILV